MAGQKNYAYSVCVGGNPECLKSICKVRGLTINSGNEHVINLKTLKNMVLEEHEPVLINIPSKISRVNKWDIVTKATSKIFRPVYGKRKMVDNYDTVPWGYKKPRIN